MADDKTGFGVGGGGVGPQTPKTPSPAVEGKSIYGVPKKAAPLGTGVITPEMEKYQAMLAKNPNSRVFAALAECYRKQGMLDEAIHLCIDGVQKYPNYMSGRVALGRAYFDKGMIKEAKEELEKVVSITPNNIVANKVLGDIHLFEEDLGGALGFFNKVISMSPED
jgi:tetratricopeptide (TPR) repeat protein